jgi:hypothetical protein
LDDKLILKVLASLADDSGGVFEDELTETFWGVRAHDVKLALGNFDDGLFAAGVAEQIA